MILYQTALKYYGLSEVPGKESNPTILKWIASALSWFQGDDSQMAWCGIFMAQVLKEAGLSEFIPNKFYRAKSWTEVGMGASITLAVKGDIAVFWRKHKDSGLGHVAIIESIKGDNINVLGGNQNNKVSIKAYPKNRLLTVRRIDKYIGTLNKREYNYLTKFLLGKI